MTESTEIAEIPPKKKAGRPRRTDKPEKVIRPVGRPKHKYVSYAEARAWVRKLRLKNFEEWKKFRHKRDNKTGKRLRPEWIPAHPYRV